MAKNLADACSNKTPADGCHLRAIETVIFMATRRPADRQFARKDEKSAGQIEKF
jgi:hypothetical protein